MGWMPVRHGAGRCCPGRRAVFAQGLSDRLAWQRQPALLEGQRCGLRAGFARSGLCRAKVLIEYQYAKAIRHSFAFAAELARLNVDVIVTSGEPAALAAKRATARSHHHHRVRFDPVKAGLVASLGKPDGNVTGLASRSEELWESGWARSGARAETGAVVGAVESRESRQCRVPG
jgi:hypothetical protein